MKGDRKRAELVRKVATEIEAAASELVAQYRAIGTSGQVHRIAEIAKGDPYIAGYLAIRCYLGARR